jgi:hypothetical protein
MIRRTTLSLLLFAACWSVTASAQFLLGVKPEVSGSWFNPTQDGHGFVVEVLDGDSLLVYWYTYRPDGTSTFLFGVLEQSGTAFTGTLSQADGMEFGSFDPADNDITPWGNLSITFSDCRTGSVTWTTTEPGFSDGSIPIQRLTSIGGFPCTDDPVAGNYAWLVANDADGWDIGRAVLLPNGRMFYWFGQLDVEAVGVGDWQQTGPLNFSFQTTFWLNDGLGGTPLPSDSLNGGSILTRDGFGVGPFQGTRLETFRRNITLAELAGSYTIVDDLSDFPFADIVLAADGSVTGTVINGCNLAGTVTIPVRGSNQVYVELANTLNSDLCRNTGFEGGGYVIDPDDVIEPDDWEIFGVNETRGYATVYKFRR